MLTLQCVLPREKNFEQTLCADIAGFSLHATVRCAADDHHELEQLCRSFGRPALSDERVQINAAGQVEFKHATPWRDGTTHLVMSRLEFMRRLAALVPRPRLHLTRFHGVLAPNAKLRALVVPQGPDVERQPTEAAPATECESGPGDKQSWHLPVPGKGPGLPRVLTGAACAAEPVLGRSPRLAWARLLRRVLDIDMQHCPNCGGGELKIIAVSLERPVIEKMLTHLGLDPQPPPKAPPASRGGLELAEPDPPSYQDDAASGQQPTRGLGPRAWAVLGLACVRRSWHQGEP